MVKLNCMPTFRVGEALPGVLSIDRGRNGVKIEISAKRLGGFMSRNSRGAELG